jgi:hypothetical protein
MGKNVMIPLSLLDCIIQFLIELDLSEYHELRYEYCEILWALRVKKQRIGLRDSYAKIISADNPDARDDARIRYMQQKQFLGLPAGEPPF